MQTRVHDIKENHVGLQLEVSRCLCIIKSEKACLRIRTLINQKPDKSSILPLTIIMQIQAKEINNKHSNHYTNKLVQKPLKPDALQANSFTFTMCIM